MYPAPSGMWRSSDRQTGTDRTQKKGTPWKAKWKYCRCWRTAVSRQRRQSGCWMPSGGRHWTGSVRKCRRCVSRWQQCRVLLRTPGVRRQTPGAPRMRRRRTLWIPAALLTRRRSTPPMRKPLPTQPRTARVTTTGIPTRTPGSGKLSPVPCGMPRRQWAWYRAFWKVWVCRASMSGRSSARG